MYRGYDIWARSATAISAGVPSMLVKVVDILL